MEFANRRQAIRTPDCDGAGLRSHSLLNGILGQFAGGARLCQICAGALKDAWDSVKSEAHLTHEQRYVAIGAAGAEKKPA